MAIFSKPARATNLADKPLFDDGNWEKPIRRNTTMRHQQFVKWFAADRKLFNMCIRNKGVDAIDKMAIISLQYNLTSLSGVVMKYKQFWRHIRKTDTNSYQGLHMFPWLAMFWCVFWGLVRSYWKYLALNSGVINTASRKFDYFNGCYSSDNRIVFCYDE
jgi:hypothetical protein